MKQVLPYLLWLGHAGEGRNPSVLFEAGIRALVEVAAEEPATPTPRDLVYCRVPLLDGVGNDAELLALATSTVATLLRRRVATLLCCDYGLSRAPAVAAAALALAFQGSPDDWLKRVA